MPPTQRDEGLRAALEARRRVPGTPILVLSQYVERQYASELLADRGGGVGYLLKDRVADVRDFMDALRRVAAGGTALDPEVVAQLMVRRRRDDRLATLTPREREVLAAMAEGRTNAGIAAALGITEGAAEKHISNIFGKLDLFESRRITAASWRCWPTSVRTPDTACPSHYGAGASGSGAPGTGRGRPGWSWSRASSDRP